MIMDHALVEPDIGKRQPGLRRLVETAVDRAAQRALLRPDEFLPAVDDDLRRIDRLEIEPGGIAVLALGIPAVTEAVFPAQPVPIVHVKSKDINGLVLIFLLDAGDELIGGRAAGTTFGSKELDDGKPFGRAGHNGGRSRMEEGAGCQEGYNEAAQQNGYSEAIFHV